MASLAKKAAIAVGVVLFCLLSTLVLRKPWLFIGSSSGVTIPIPVESSTLEILKVGPSNVDETWLQEDSGDVIVEDGGGIVDRPVEAFGKESGSSFAEEQLEANAESNGTNEGEEESPEGDEGSNEGENERPEDDNGTNEGENARPEDDDGTNKGEEDRLESDDGTNELEGESPQGDDDTLAPLTDDDIVIDFGAEPVEPEAANASIEAIEKERISVYARWCGGAPPKVKPWRPSTPNLNKPPSKPIDKGSAKRELGRCLRDISACGMGAATAARTMPSIRRLGRFRKGSFRGLARFKSCAIVGNSGHILKKEYGPYIDAHDAVVRFNILSLSPRFAPHIGTRTTIRVLNHRHSYSVCRAPNKLPENAATSKKGGGKAGGKRGGGNPSPFPPMQSAVSTSSTPSSTSAAAGGATGGAASNSSTSSLSSFFSALFSRASARKLLSTTQTTPAPVGPTPAKKPPSLAPGHFALKMMLLWHPLERARIHACLKRKYGRRLKVISTSPRVESELKRTLLALRRDAGGSLSLRRFRGGRSRQQLTSGAHGILLMLRMCEHLSLYGMTTYPSSRKGPDQYRGRKGKPNTAFRVHDWSGESAAWRLLHASGKATICSV